GVLLALARHRGDATALAIHECEGRPHRQRQRRLADHPWQCENTPLPPAGGAPTENDTTSKQRATAASPAVPLDKTPAAGLATPAEKIATTKSNTPSATTPEGPRSLWPLSLSAIETYLSRIVRTEPNTEPRSRQPSERPAAEQPR